MEAVLEFCLSHRRSDFLTKWTDFDHHTVFFKDWFESKIIFVLLKTFRNIFIISYEISATLT